MDYLDKPDPQTFIAHHGIKGQKWGVRRFQNADGSLTKAGKERYNEPNAVCATIHEKRVQGSLECIYS